MDIKDKDKLKRLRHTFDLNYRLTNLYSRYLTSCPELITREIVGELTGDGEIGLKDALVALVAEILGLDDSRGGDDRRLIRDYISRSVTLLDADKYYNDPYYKNIKISNIKNENWEFRLESYPPFRAIVANDMVTEDDLTEYAPLGFFPTEFKFPAVLEDGNEWMTLTPVDLDTSEKAIAAAHGKVVTFGLGLGYYAYMVSEKPEVNEIYIVEKSERVIELFKKHILPQFSHGYKVKIINKDAFLYAREDMPRERFDLAFVDTWRDASDGEPMYRRMKALEHLSPDTKFMYWIEGFLRSRVRAMNFEELWDKLESGAADAPANYQEFMERLNKI